jgi:DNA modification methylase
MTGRHFIGIERDAQYFQIAKDRIEQTVEKITPDVKQLTTQMADQEEQTPPSLCITEFKMEDL